MREIQVKENDKNQRLDRFVGKAVPLLPDSLLQKYIRLKRIKVNGKKADRATRLMQGDTVQLYIGDEFFEKPNDNNAYLKVGNPKLDIVYEDDDLAVINKPQGMCVHPAVGNYSGTLVNALTYRYKHLSNINGDFRPGIVHRLDKDTSGLLIVAKNDYSHIRIYQLANLHLRLNLHQFLCIFQ